MIGAREQVANARMALEGSEGYGNTINWTLEDQHKVRGR